MDDQNKFQSWARVTKWAARIWSIPAILFAGAHLVFPDSEPGVEVLWYEWLAVGTLFASVFALLLGWWKPKVGGWASLGLLVLALIIYSIYRGELFPLEGLIVLLIGVAAPAALFLVADRLRKTE